MYKLFQNPSTCPPPHTQKNRNKILRVTEKIFRKFMGIQEFNRIRRRGLSRNSHPTLNHSQQVFVMCTADLLFPNTVSSIANARESSSSEQPCSLFRNCSQNVPRIFNAYSKYMNIHYHPERSVYLAKCLQWKSKL